MFLPMLVWLVILLQCGPVNVLTYVGVAGEGGVEVKSAGSCNLLTVGPTNELKELERINI